MCIVMGECIIVFPLWVGGCKQIANLNTTCDGFFLNGLLLEVENTKGVVLINSECSQHRIRNQHTQSAKQILVSYKRN